MNQLTKLSSFGELQILRRNLPKTSVWLNF